MNTIISAAKVVKKIRLRKYLRTFFIFFCIFHKFCVLLQPQINDFMRRNMFLALIALCMLSCGRGNDRLLTSATGSIYECLIVSDAKVKEAVCETMGADMYGLPQMEPTFTVSHVTPAQFDDLFKGTRNILLVDINPSKYTMVKATKSRDVWSKPQAMLRIQAPSDEAFLAYWKDKGASIREWFVREELARQLRFYRASTNKEAREILNKQGYDLIIP